MTELPIPRCLILDACWLIDLHASGYMAAILQSLPYSVAVSQYVLEQEALSVGALSGHARKERAHSEQTSASDIPPLQQLLDSGIIVVVNLETEAEENALVDFAVSLEDGEAYTCAIAVQRNWIIASTERKVASMIRNNFSHISVVTTQELVKEWADATNPPNEVVKQVIQNIQEKARYRPRRSHPLYEWWQELAEN